MSRYTLHYESEGEEWSPARSDDLEYLIGWAENERDELIYLYASVEDEKGNIVWDSEIGRIEG